MTVSSSPARPCVSPGSSGAAAQPVAKLAAIGLHQYGRIADAATGMADDELAAALA